MKEAQRIQVASSHNQPSPSGSSLIAVVEVLVELVSIVLDQIAK